MATSRSKTDTGRNGSQPAPAESAETEPTQRSRSPPDDAASAPRASNLNMPTPANESDPGVLLPDTGTNDPKNRSPRAQAEASRQVHTEKSRPDPVSTHDHQPDGRAGNTIADENVSKGPLSRPNTKAETERKGSAKPRESGSPEIRKSDQHIPDNNSRIDPIPENSHPSEWLENITKTMSHFFEAIELIFSTSQEGSYHPLAPHVVDVADTFSNVAHDWLSRPEDSIRAYTGLVEDSLDWWRESLSRFQDGSPDASTTSPDRRFSHPDWGKHPLYWSLRAAFDIGSRHMNRLVGESRKIDNLTRLKANLYTRIFLSALSPANYAPTNPELTRTTIRERAANLARGMEYFVEDLQAGDGLLKINQSDDSHFHLGETLATTPGKVIFRNDLIELIQYSPQTSQVFSTPLLIVPPWINKYYILDLNAEKSMIRWLIEQGITVFCISWVNPDSRHSGADFDAYADRGILAAVNAITDICDTDSIAAMGYCIGGTLLAGYAAAMKAKGDHRLQCLSLFTSQLDFVHAGELAVFGDEKRIEAIEADMAKTGYLESNRMSMTFNLLRSSDLIWPYIVQNYQQGRRPPPFDILSWNADSTRLTQANLSFYLRNFYRRNAMAKGNLILCGETIDLSSLRIPSFFVGARDDHIAPARSVLSGSKLMGGPAEFILGDSGHIAGMINPPSRNKYQYWYQENPELKESGDLASWISTAQTREGSWWPYWLKWLKPRLGSMIDTPPTGSRAYRELTNAPGEFVQVRH